MALLGFGEGGWGGGGGVGGRGGGGRGVSKPVGETYGVPYDTQPGSPPYAIGAIVRWVPHPSPQTEQTRF